MVQQIDQAGDLLFRVRLSHGLGSGVEPSGITSLIDELNTQTSLIESTHVMGDALKCNPLFNPAVPVYVVVPRMACAGFRIMNPQPKFSGGSEVGEFRAMYNNQVYQGSLAPIEILCIGQEGLVDDDSAQQ